MPLTLRITGLWVLYCTWATSTGWILSAFQRLDPQGYVIAAIPGILLAIWWWLGTRPSHGNGGNRLKKLWLRALRDPSCAAWLAVVFLLLLGGAIHQPSNYDGLTYRLPRMLYWLQEQQWHRIGSIDYRLDIAGTGYEWLSIPVFLLGGGERFLFLINLLPFLLLPSLYFISAKGIGVSPATARKWMFLVPMAYGLATQAASIGNDLTVCILALASFAFAAYSGHRPALCLAISACAVAVMSSVKLTSLPLMLPLGAFWLYRACVPGRTLGNFAMTFGLLPVIVCASFLPLAYLHHRDTGAWTGNPGNQYGFEVQNPLAGFAGNSLSVATGLLAPPVLPAASQIDSSIHGRLVESGWYQWIKTKYPAFGFEFRHEIPSEESSGIGLPLALTFIVWLLTSRRLTGPHSQRGIIGLAWPAFMLLASIAFLAKGGAGASTARLMVPFTPFLMIAIQLVFPRRPGRPEGLAWKFASVLPALALVPTLLLNPNRPLLTASLVSNAPILSRAIKERVLGVYEVYSKRGSLLEPLAAEIPRGQPIGYAGGVDHSSVALFRPYGQSIVLDYQPANEEKVRWVVGTREGIETRMGVSLESWQEMRFVMIHSIPITSRVTTGPETWYVFRRK